MPFTQFVETKVNPCNEKRAMWRLAWMSLSKIMHSWKSSERQWNPGKHFIFTSLDRSLSQCIYLAPNLNLNPVDKKNLALFQNGLTTDFLPINQTARAVFFHKAFMPCLQFVSQTRIFPFLPQPRFQSILDGEISLVSTLLGPLPKHNLDHSIISSQCTPWGRISDE